MQKLAFVYVYILTHMHTYSDLLYYHFYFFSWEDGLLFQAPAVNFLRHWLNLPSICPHCWDHWDGGLEAKHPGPHSQSKTMAPFPSLLISSRSYAKTNKAAAWSHSWALQPLRCTAGAGKPSPVCRVQWLWGHTWGEVANPTVPWAGVLPSGLVLRYPKDIRPHIVPAWCCCRDPGWGWHHCPPAWGHMRCGGAVAQPACPVLLGHQGLRKCRNMSLRKSGVF